uniref:Putative secreted protein n=1 Tax=Panstrongylus lignarius TaxID=156445 RepID=A0A224Y3M4_9HEMI
MTVLNTIRHLVDFFLLLPELSSGNLCSTSTFRSFNIPTQSHVAIISFEGSNSISMRTVPSTFFSTHGVEFFPETRHA